MNATSTERRPDLVSRPENALELLRQVYEEAGLDAEDARQAAHADLVALYASTWSLE